MTEIDVKKLVLDAIQNKKPALLKELFEDRKDLSFSNLCFGCAGVSIASRGLSRVAESGGSSLVVV